LSLFSLTWPWHACITPVSSVIVTFEGWELTCDAWEGSSVPQVVRADESSHLVNK